MSLPLDYVIIEIFVLVMVGIIGSAICEKISHTGELRKTKSLTTGTAKVKRKWV